MLKKHWEYYVKLCQVIVVVVVVVVVVVAVAVVSTSQIVLCIGSPLWCIHYCLDKPVLCSHISQDIMSLIDEELLVFGRIIVSLLCSPKLWQNFLSYQAWYITEVKIFSWDVILAHFWHYCPGWIAHVWGILWQNSDDLLCDCLFHIKSNRTWLSQITCQEGEL